MITFFVGDILNSKAEVICQQVNCQGVMGSGLAKQIRNKYPLVYDMYKVRCNEYVDKAELLGQIYNFKSREDNVIICNIFGQLNYGRGKLQTDYDALRKAFKTISIVHKNRTIAIPFNIGCGLAGGDWGIVLEIINDIFKNSECEVQISRLR